jgi:hypothetical protein
MFDGLAPKAKFEGVEVLWSYTNEFPCTGEAGVNGSFRDQQHIKIAPFGQLKFMQEFVYLGIYVRAGLSCNIAHGFGSSCLRSLQLSFKKSANLGSPAYAHRGQKVKRMNQSQTDQAFKDSVERQIR